MQNKISIKALTDALNVGDTKKESVYGIIGRMEVLLDIFKSEPKYHSLVPFLETYYLVTKAVAEKEIIKDYYEDFKKLEELDVNFAKLYFEPLKKYLEFGSKISPWQSYFSYCENPSGLPYLQMLVGINVHINADLTSTLVNIGYDNRNDFLIINKILDEQIPKVMNFLAFNEHDPVGLGGVVFKDFFEKEFKNIVVRWRNEAWQNALLIKKEKPRNWHSQLCKRTEELSQEIIDLFGNLIHLNHPITSLDKLNKLSTNLK